jgi:hypothetical protein
MSKNIISPEDIGRIAGDIALNCDLLELESVIRQLEIVLRFARSRLQRNTELDQRLHAAAQDENYYTKVVNDED